MSQQHVRATHLQNLSPKQNCNLPQEQLQRLLLAHGAELAQHCSAGSVLGVPSPTATSSTPRMPTAEESSSPMTATAAAAATAQVWQHTAIAGVTSEVVLLPSSSLQAASQQLRGMLQQAEMALRRATVPVLCRQRVHHHHHHQLGSWATASAGCSSGHEQGQLIWPRDAKDIVALLSQPMLQEQQQQHQQKRLPVPIRPKHEAVALAQALRSLKFLSELPWQVLLEAMAVATIQSYAAGQQLRRHVANTAGNAANGVVGDDERGNTWLVVMRGTLQASQRKDHLPNGNVPHIRVLAAGDGYLQGGSSGGDRDSSHDCRSSWDSSGGRLSASNAAGELVIAAEDTLCLCIPAVALEAAQGASAAAEMGYEAAANVLAGCALFQGWERALLGHLAQNVARLVSGCLILRAEHALGTCHSI